MNTSKTHSDRIVVGIDGSGYSTQVLQSAALFSDALKLPLEIISCWHRSDIYFAAEIPIGGIPRVRHPRRRGGPSGGRCTRARVWPGAASCHAPISMTYSNANAPRGKRHSAAVMCLARRRCDVLYSMIKNGTLYEEKTPVAA